MSNTSHKQQRISLQRAPRRPLRAALLLAASLPGLAPVAALAEPTEPGKTDCRLLTLEALLQSDARCQRPPLMAPASAGSLAAGSAQPTPATEPTSASTSSPTVAARTQALEDEAQAAMLPFDEKRLPSVRPAPQSVMPASTKSTTRPAAKAASSLDVRRILTLDPLVQATAQRHDIDPLLLHALAHVESRHHSEAVSPAGARGLMQLMPATARGVGVADGGLHEPAQNLEASARYLKRLQQRFGNELSLVLAAYNAGEGAVERHGRRVPPYAETQAYVRDVLALYRQLRLRLLTPGLRAQGQA